ncbi:ribonuclease HII [Halococcus sp. IIIV-5B]|uniref:ribonuclease HII n=1 Tax=Halococcus sp. IIIV-5B TaxID=2321230 RepID=UPI000E76D463|nr:ribonuclease HII [Halococcus sp. IIIV-5B]RJT00383.1 ribonuclease HII [Halococcus sp. IIIV-5B]
MRFGVDEAGRGPVLGSLFVACVRADPAVLPEAIDDSKRLPPARREALATDLHGDDRVSTAVVEVTASEIDDPETDINALTITAAAGAIDEAVEDGLAGIVDACDTDAARFGRRVTAATDANVAVTAEHGADENHALAGAASIVAKVARDAHIDRLAEEYGLMGSGYPSDPNTREFLREYVREHGELPSFARASWKTSRDVLDAAAQSTFSNF